MPLQGPAPGQRCPLLQVRLAAASATCLLGALSARLYVPSKLLPSLAGTSCLAPTALLSFRFLQNSPKVCARISCAVPLCLEPGQSHVRIE